MQRKNYAVISNSSHSSGSPLAADQLQPFLLDLGLHILLLISAYLCMNECTCFFIQDIPKIYSIHNSISLNPRLFTLTTYSKHKVIFDMKIWKHIFLSKPIVLRGFRQWQSFIDVFIMKTEESDYSVTEMIVSHLIITESFCSFMSF